MEEANNYLVLDVESAGFIADSLQYTAKYISEADGTLVETYFLLKEKKNISHRKAGWQRGEKVQREDLGWKRKTRCHGRQKYPAACQGTILDQMKDVMNRRRRAERNCSVLSMADPCYHPCFPI